LTNVTGPLDFGFRTYTIDPDLATPPTVGVQPGFVPVPDPTTNELTVASFNMERFFDTIDDPGISDPVLTVAAFNRRVAKASLIVRTVQKYPDVIGVQEMENLTTLQTVAAKINTDAVTIDGLPNPNYTAYLVEGNDVGGIDVGFLVKQSRVTPSSTFQLELPGCVSTAATCYNFVNPNTGGLDLLNDRPPLVLTASIPRPGGGTLTFTVIVNHLRSLGGIDDNTVSGSGTVGARVREKRRKQAEFLANYIQGRQTADPNENIITLGDMNAFRVNDGYVDSIGTILGTPAPADQVVLPSADLVNPNQTDLVDDIPPLHQLFYNFDGNAKTLGQIGGELPANERYSYNFDGNAQTLDHIIVNPPALGILTRVAYARNDSDFPVKNYENTSELRISDHDQPVAYFNLLIPTAANVSLAGRVLTSDGRGIRNAMISVDGGSLTERLWAQTGTFGYYRFEGLVAGETYIITVNSGRFTFPMPTRVITIVEDLREANFIANPENEERDQMPPPTDRRR
jgi:predicted extracellular nuclease